MYWLEAVLGLALIAAPFALGYRDNPAALWGSIVIGLIVVLISGYRAYKHETERWEGWVGVVAGVAAILVPFIFGFSAVATALWSFVVIGLLIAILSGYDLYTTREAAA
ncbi:MAG: SPW repeat protein [Chloroflexota bacterium]|nr:MAG: hypothetical protein DIU80_21870 [Chloroflexota bacterium]